MLTKHLSVINKPQSFDIWQKDLSLRCLCISHWKLINTISLEHETTKSLALSYKPVLHSNTWPLKNLGGSATAHTLVALLEELNSAANTHGWWFTAAYKLQLPWIWPLLSFVYILICTNLYTDIHITKTFLKDQRKYKYIYNTYNTYKCLLPI